MNSHAYSSSSHTTQKLLDREQPEGYAKEALDTIRHALTEEIQELKSILIFRIGKEWLALPTKAVKEVREDSLIHKLPHRSNQILLGITNVQGELKISVSLRNLLNLQDQDPEQTSTTHRIYPRVVVFGIETNDFVFPADEVFGVAHIKPDIIESVPINIAKSMQTFTIGVFNFKSKRIGLLNEKHILEYLNDKHL